MKQVALALHVVDAYWLFINEAISIEGGSKFLQNESNWPILEESLGDKMRFLSRCIVASVLNTYSKTGFAVPSFNAKYN